MSAAFTQISPTVWALQSRSMAYNSGVILDGEHACLIDPGPHPDEVEQALLFVAKRGAQIDSVVLTHSHWDHILGPERMRPELIVTTNAFTRVTKRDRAMILKMIERWEGRFEYQRQKPFFIPRPDATFDDSIELEIGNLHLQLMEIPGHAEDQLAIYDPSTATLWAADTLSDIEIPYVMYSLSAYERSLARLAGLEIAALVPGHGNPTSDSADIAARIAFDRAYLAELRTRVGAALAEGLDVTATVERCADMDIHDVASNRGGHRLNVESAYIELGGAADRDLVGWSRKDLFDE